MKIETYYHEKVIQGLTQNALQFSSINNIPIQPTQTIEPYKLDFLPVNMDLSFCGLKNEKKILTGRNEEENLIVGSITKQQLFYRLSLLCSLSGLQIPQSVCQGVTLVEDNRLKQHLPAGRFIFIEFEELYIAHPSNIKLLSLEVEEFDDKLNNVYDEFETDLEMNIDLIHDNSEFPDYIHFHQNQIITHSKLTRKEQREFDFGEFMMTKVLANILEDCQKHVKKARSKLIHSGRHVANKAALKYANYGNKFFINGEKIETIQEMGREGMSDVFKYYARVM